MAIIQCKICGGEIEVPPNMTMGECPYCHEVTTFPRFDLPDIEALYRQAEDARLTCNFDKAISGYEEIINRGTTDPEIYWGLVLSSWGIEYVEDPLTKERKPTCHRVQFESILDDANYKKVLELAIGDEAQIYQKEAQRIADIQKNILMISAQEKPYDIFICYKESDDSGQRTEDSVFAQELYDKLCEQGYKVFFARVTLEDKVGLYEPHIFAALNSAKVMLVIGSKKEYFEAAWVRNEWSRFLFLMQKQTEKILIPCYRDMDAYDIPREMSMFQAQDMNKIGFTQDLLHGLNKVLGNKASEHTHNTKSRKILILVCSVIAIFALIVIVLITRNSNGQAEARAAKIQAEAQAAKIQAEAQAAKKQAEAQAAKIQAEAEAAKIRAEAAKMQPAAPVKRRKALAKPPQKNENPVAQNLKKYLVIDLSSGQYSKNYPVRSTDTPPDINDDKCRTSELWLRRIEPGEFIMGAPKNVTASLKANPQREKSVSRSGNVTVIISNSSSFEEGEYDRNLPMHRVKISKPYYIGVFEVTQAQFQLVMGETGTLKENKERNPLFPVTQPTGTRMRDASSYNLMQIMNKEVLGNVGWPSCGHNVTDESFLGKLRSRTKLLFDLPTEAQWEYACRAGTKNNLYSGKNLLYGDSDPHLDKLANYRYNSNEHLTKVGSYKPNSWGLYDMLGNAREACLDTYETIAYQKMADAIDPLGPVANVFNVSKGGGYDDPAYKCCSHSRTTCTGSPGFRIVFLPTPVAKLMFGLSWNPDNSVAWVAPDFPAEQAGIQEGDIIIEVNGKPLQLESQSNKWEDLVKATDSSVKIKFKRGEKIMTTTMNR